MDTVCLLQPFYITDKCFTGCATIFAKYIKDIFGIDLTPGKGNLLLQTDSSLEAESYRLEVENQYVILSASTTKGMHNGLADLLSKVKYENNQLFVPIIRVVETPDCAYRGLMMDLARQWHPLSCILEYIDLCWKNRATHLQLHFSDFQSFTLPISSFPKLSTEGRTYTREEIKIMVEYAYNRGITLVPEIDVPGHTTPFFQTYPELFGTSGILPACDEVFDALREIFSEVAAMFPYSPLIHLGGDEASIHNWENCARTQAYMKANKIADIHEMYAEYIRIVTNIIFDLERTPVVWEGFSKEYNDRIDKRTIVIAWENYYQPAYDLAAAGFTLINCSWKPLYVCTGNDQRYWPVQNIAAHHPWKWEHWMDTSAAYPSFEIDRSYPVLGSQLCAWGDFIAEWENRSDAILQEMRLVSERMSVLCAKLWNLTH